MSIRVINLTKRVEDMWVLRDVTFEANAGEVFGIFGQTGSGKTTLINAIAGDFPLNSGSVFFNETDITTLNGNSRRITRPHLGSGSFLSRLFRNDPAADRGDRRRALDAAIDAATDVLLLDEPIPDVDRATRSSYIEKVRSMSRERELVTIIASSDYDLMLEACDRIAVLGRGEIAQIGTPQDVYEHPSSRLVAEMTGRNNLFSARRLTSSKAEITEFHTIDGGHRLFAQKIERSALGALNQNATLSIRPEHISISFGASFPADNLLKATVAGIRFLGPTTLVEMDADGLRLQALVLRVVGLNVGDECMVGLPPDRILIFRD